MTIHFQSRGVTFGLHAAGPDGALTLACAFADPAADFGSTLGPSKVGAGMRVGVAVIVEVASGDAADDAVRDCCGLAQPVSAARTNIVIPTARSAQRSVFRVVAIPGPRANANNAIPLTAPSRPRRFLRFRDISGTNPSARRFAKKLPVLKFLSDVRRRFQQSESDFGMNLRELPDLGCRSKPGSRRHGFVSSAALRR